MAAGGERVPCRRTESLGRTENEEKSGVEKRAEKTSGTKETERAVRERRVEVQRGGRRRERQGQTLRGVE